MPNQVTSSIRLDRKKRNNSTKGVGQRNHNLITAHGNSSNDNENTLLFHLGHQTNISFKRDNEIDKAKMQNFVTDQKLVFNQSADRLRLDYKANHKRGLVKTANLFYQGLISFGREDSLLTREQCDSMDSDAMDKSVIEFCTQICKENNIDINTLSITKHNDETMTHYHFDFLGYNFQKHELMYKAMNKYYLIGLQDKLAKAFQDNNLPISRGIKVQERLDNYFDDKSNNMTASKYADLDHMGKRGVKSQANAINRSLKELHSTQKADLVQLNQKISTKAELYQHLLDSDVEYLQDHKAKFADDKNLKTLLTYAIRAKSEQESTREKAEKHLKAKIERLNKSSKESYIEFMRELNDKKKSQINKFNETLEELKTKEKQLNKTTEQVESQESKLNTINEDISDKTEQIEELLLKIKKTFRFRKSDSVDEIMADLVKLSNKKSSRYDDVSLKM